MLNHSLREQFLEKQSANFSAEQLLDHFRYYFKKYSRKHSDHPTEELRNCLWYIKKLLTKFHPNVSMKLVCSQKGQAPLPQNIEENYIHLMHTVALLELYHENYRSAAHWAKKTLDLISFFHPCITADKKRQLIINNPSYFDCFRLHHENKDYFDETLHRELVFEWEKNLFEPNHLANQN